MKVAMVPKPIEPSARPQPWGRTRPSTCMNGRRSPATMGAAVFGQASSRPMIASNTMLTPMLHSPNRWTSSTPSGAPTANAP
ncbi:hypothetical protein D3C78_1761230 [compost metagenome]